MQPDYQKIMAEMRNEIEKLLSKVEYLEQEDCDSTIETCAYISAYTAKINKIARDLERQNNEFWGR